MCLVVHVDDYAKKAKSQILLQLLMKNHTCTRMHAGAHRIRLHKQVVTVKHLFPRNPECAWSSTWTPMRKRQSRRFYCNCYGKPHMHVHACRCASVCVCVCVRACVRLCVCVRVRVWFFAQLTRLSSGITCRRASPVSYCAVEAALGWERRKTADPTQPAAGPPCGTESDLLGGH